MANLSITTAWNEASAFVRREAHLLFPIAFLLGSLPGAAAQLLAPQQPAPGQAPEAGAWMLAVFVSVLIGFVASLAISWLALRPGVSVGEALGRGFKRFLPMVAATMIVSIGVGLLMFLLAIVAVLVVPGAMQGLNNGGAPGPQATTAIGVTLLLVLPILIYIIPRLLLSTPVAAAEDVGPIAILRRSWQISSGNYWKLLGFLLLFILAYLVVSMAIGFVLGTLVVLAAGRPEPGTIAFLIILLLNAVVGAIVTMFFTATLARIYAQLTGGGVAEVFR